MSVTQNNNVYKTINLSPDEQALLRAVLANFVLDLSTRETNSQAVGEEWDIQVKTACTILGRMVVA